MFVQFPQQIGAIFVQFLKASRKSEQTSLKNGSAAGQGKPKMRAGGAG